MQTKIAICVVLVFAFLATGCVANQPKNEPLVGVLSTDTEELVVTGNEVATKQPSELTTQPEVLKPEEIVREEPGLSVGNQAITGHQVTKRWGMDRLTFTTARPVPNKKSWAFVCDELAGGQIPSHVSFYWHGDDPNFWLRQNPNKIAERGKEINSDTCWIMPYRPHSKTKKHWRSRDEIRYHLAVVDYFIALGVESFDVYGYSGGGLVAVAVLQERRRHVKFAGLASPVLAVKKWFGSKVSNWWVYDPHYHMERLLFRTPEMPAVCILAVWDPRDRKVPKRAILPYIEKARELGLGDDQVRLVRVRVNSQNRHTGSHKNLRREMRKLKREGGFCL